jgi:hypothetical protein
VANGTFSHSVIPAQAGIQSNKKFCVAVHTVLCRYAAMLVLLDSRLRGNDEFLGNDGRFFVWRMFKNSEK